MASEEFAHDLHVPLPFFPHRQVGTVREDRELRATDPSMDRPGDPRADLVVLAARDERGDLDRRTVIRDVPVPDGALDREFGGPPHGPVARPAEVLDRAREVAKP